MGKCVSFEIIGECSPTKDVASIDKPLSSREKLTLPSSTAVQKASSLSISENVSFSAESSNCYSNDEEHMTSSSELIFFDKDSSEHKKMCKSFDGRNKRVSNRYDFGIAMLEAQIHHGADPNKLRTHGDRTCLMFAVLAGNFTFVKKLLKMGVDINQTNRQDETALRFALELGRNDIADYLRTKGALDVEGAVNNQP